MKILVTGGAGFIGSNLIDILLEQGHTIVCVDDLSLGTKENLKQVLENQQFVFIEADLLDQDRLDSIFEEHKPDVVFHLAANSDIQKGSTDRTVDLQKTFMTTFKVLEVMAKKEIKQFVFASTSAVYGDTKGIAVDEDFGPLLPVSFYGAAKLSAEAFTSVYAHHFGIQSWVFRFPNVIGPRLTHGVIYDFHKKLKADPSTLNVLGDGTQTKPYIHVHDLIEAILFGWNNAKEPFNYFNIAAKGSTTVREIAEMTVEESGLKEAKIVYGKENIGWKGDVPKFEYQTDKLKNLGWECSRSSNEAVRLAIQHIWKA